MCKYNFLTVLYSPFILLEILLSFMICLYSIGRPIADNVYKALAKEFSYCGDECIYYSLAMG